MRIERDATGVTAEVLPVSGCGRVLYLESRVGGGIQPTLAVLLEAPPNQPANR
jgi:hypothetical protein